MTRPDRRLLCPGAVDWILGVFMILSSLKVLFISSSCGLFPSQGPCRPGHILPLCPRRVRGSVLAGPGPSQRTEIMCMFTGKGFYGTEGWFYFIKK